MDRTAHETAVLGGGCFWCLDAVFRDLNGVIGVESGYAGGARADPTYEDICTGRTGHAEVVALREAAASLGEWRLSGCTLIVTLEPCTMCAGAAVLARVDRIVFGAYDDKAGAVGSLWDVVRDRRLNHRPEVIAGVCAEECAELLDDFFKSHRDSPERP